MWTRLQRAGNGRRPRGRNHGWPGGLSAQFMGDAMLVKHSSQAEQLAVGGSELAFELADDADVAGVFVAEPRGKRMHNPAVC